MTKHLREKDTPMAVLELPGIAEMNERLSRIEALLAAQQPQEEDLWTVRDVARHRKVTEATVRKHAREGRIPVAERIGQRMRFDPSVIKALSK